MGLGLAPEVFSAICEALCGDGEVRGEHGGRRGGGRVSVRPPAPPPHHQSALESYPSRSPASLIPQIRC